MDPTRPFPALQRGLSVMTALDGATPGQQHNSHLPGASGSQRIKTMAAQFDAEIEAQKRTYHHVDSETQPDGAQADESPTKKGKADVPHVADRVAALAQRIQVGSGTLVRAQDSVAHSSGTLPAPQDPPRSSMATRSRALAATSTAHDQSRVSAARRPGVQPAPVADEEPPAPAVQAAPRASMARRPTALASASIAHGQPRSSAARRPGAQPAPVADEAPPAPVVQAAPRASIARRPMALSAVSTAHDQPRSSVARRPGAQPAPVAVAAPLAFDQIRASVARRPRPLAAAGHDLLRASVARRPVMARHPSQPVEDGQRAAPSDTN